MIKIELQDLTKSVDFYGDPDVLLSAEEVRESIEAMGELDEINEEEEK